MFNKLVLDFLKEKFSKSYSTKRGVDLHALKKKPLTDKHSFFTFLGVIAVSCTLWAQPKTGQFVNVSVGLGITAYEEVVDFSGSGFYVQGEYVHAPKKWLGLRPYLGLILTSADDNAAFPNTDVSTSAVLIGGKARILAPIPWVAPYIELGIGTSIGSFKTLTPFTDISKSGLVAHIPFSIGLAVGKRNGVDIAFTYYYHPSNEQFAGAAAFGLSFRLD